MRDELNADHHPGERGEHLVLLVERRPKVVERLGVECEEGEHLDVVVVLELVGHGCEKREKEPGQGVRG